MKWRYLLAVPLALMPLAPAVVLAQQPPAAQDGAPALSRAELEQILAPIALYPDELLTQVLVASTYPLEVVMASRWLQQGNNKSLKGDPLLQALNSQDWDPSVKSLVPFPDVVNTMSTQLDWTQKLGDAFLAQESDVLAAVQSLRARAQAAGSLQTNAQQVVSKDADAIVIAPAQPSVVYVPAYNPTVVYGTWPYASYPPVYYPPPPGAYVGTALLTGLAFGAGVAITSSLWGWGRPNWGGGSVNVNVNRFNTINSNQFNNYKSNRVVNNGNTWQHNNDHRRGVAYNNPKVNQQYRPNAGANAGQRDAFRGRPPGANAPNAGNRPGGVPNAPRPGGGNGAPNLQRPNAGANAAPRPNAPQRPAPGAGPGANRPAPANRPAAPNGGAALRGTNNGAAARAQSAQGRASRQGAAPQRPAGGNRPAGGGGQRGGHR